MKKFFKETKLGRFLAGFAKGAARSIPVGNAIMDGIENIASKKDDKAPHRWPAIVAEIVFVGLISYAFITKMITVDQLINVLKMFAQIEPSIP